jgi:hypothetical protein
MSRMVALILQPVTTIQVRFAMMDHVTSRPICGTCQLNIGFPLHKQLYTLAKGHHQGTIWR